MQKKEDQGGLRIQQNISFLLSPSILSSPYDILLPSSLRCLNLFPVENGVRIEGLDCRGCIRGRGEGKKKGINKKRKERKKKEEMEETSNPRVLSEEGEENVGRFFAKNFFVSRRKEKIPAN